MTFWNFTFFRKHFLTSPYEYSNEWVDDVISSQFSTHFIIEITKISYFSHETVNIALYPLKINEKCLVWYILIQGYAFTCICNNNNNKKRRRKKKKGKKKSCIIYDKLWGDDITNSLIWIFIRTGQGMFSEKMWNFKMSYM